MDERIIKLIGSDNLDKIKSKTVLVVGIGGVGGFAVESLVRSGIKKLIIVDYDTIDITNLNRQIITNRNNIGLNKVDVCSDRCKSINEDVEIIKIKKKLNIENISEL